jgi:osmotically-inducible protein OsmY
MKKLLSIGAIAALVAFLKSERGKITLGRLRGGVGGVRGKSYDDQTLKAKVESELFRDESEVKGSINVNAQQGVIQLRGELPSQDLIQTLVERTKKIQGVKDVENLLHTPGTPAPMHE